jgi:antitoxin component of RelBE/YafQ-DinJ toxin-antitoxin module
MIDKRPVKEKPMNLFIRCDEALRDTVREIANERGLTMSQVVRQALEMFARSHTPKIETRLSDLERRVALLEQSTTPTNPRSRKISEPA